MSVDPGCLHYDQFQAYDIITAHLNAILAGQNLRPLHMLVHGEPGTGKSKAIQTVTVFCAQTGQIHVAKISLHRHCSIPDSGKTTHTIAMISPWKDNTISTESKAKLQAHWKHIQYLVIDEVLMISKSFLAKLL